MMRRCCLVAASLGLIGCPGRIEFEDAAFSVSSTTTSTGLSTTSTGTTSGDDTEGSGDDSAGSGEDSEASDGESTGAGSTGEAISDWALRFDGTTVASKDDGAYGWNAEAWTVEAWIEIEDTAATGIIFESEDVNLTTGWVLYLHSDLHALTFSFFDHEHANQVVIGPAVEDIGPGWHHIAATNGGEGTVYIHVDGVATTTQVVSSTVADPNEVLWKIGGNVNANPDFNLRDVVLDDLRITESPLYSAPFDPPIVFEWSDTTALLLSFDEGDGARTEDGFTGFAIENPQWVAGYGR